MRAEGAGTFNTLSLGNGPAHPARKQKNMNRYNVLVEITIEDAVYPVGSIVELEAEVAAPSVEAGELELIVDTETPTVE